jgi:hypothetical protein
MSRGPAAKPILVHDRGGNSNSVEPPPIGLNSSGTSNGRLLPQDLHQQGPTP